MGDSSAVSIFVSYGRRDASQFVGRMVEDLTAAGFEVWRDTSQLQSPHPWDAQLAEAIKRCDLVVAVLTPHAVRTGSDPTRPGDESVCLDELAYARFSPPPTPIVPLLLSPCEPPFVIFRLNYLDFLNAAADEAKYRTDLAKLVATIRSVKAGEKPGYRTDQAEMKNFQPLDFDLYLQVKTRDFVGRAWLLEEVSAALQSADAPGAFLLTADPGWGKTAFAAHLLRTNPGGQLLAAHFCRADLAETTDPRRFIESIVATAMLRIPEFRVRIEQLGSKPEELLAKASFNEAFEQLFLRPLAALDATELGQMPRYLLVDSLDEAASTTRSQSIGELLAQTLPLFPEWLKLVATSRDRASALDPFADAAILKLSSHDPRNRQDVQAIVHQALANLSESSDALRGTIADKADGNALCAAQLALAVRRSGLDAASIGNLPRGLSSLYLAMLQRRFDSRGPEWAAVRQLLEIVLATREAMPVEVAAIVLGDTAQYATRQAVDSISDLLVRQGDAIHLFHLSLTEFLIQPASPFFANAAEGAARLLAVALDRRGRVQLKPEFKMFCTRNLAEWIVRSNDIEKYLPGLEDLYDEMLFSAPPDHPSNYVNGVKVDADTERLIRHLAAHGAGEGVIAIIELAWRRGVERFNDSGALRWVREGYLPAPEGPLRMQIARQLNYFLLITQFALAWTKALAEARPDLRARLLELSKSQSKLRWALGWLDVGAGAHTLGISGFYEDQTSAIGSDWSEIEARLR